MCFGTYKQVVGWGGGQAVKVRGAQDLNLVVKKPDISHRFVKHRRRICLHHFNFRVSTSKHQYMPFKYIYFSFLQIGIEYFTLPKGETSCCNVVTRSPSFSFL
jgi:hypothetical protein